MNTVTKRIACAVTAGAGAVSLSLIPATANAAPNDHVPGTNCTVAQVERATNAIAPEATAALAQVPGGKAQAETFITSTPEQRGALIDKLKKENPLAAKYYAAHKQEIDAKIAKVIATCSQY
ncbi:hemophore-related protein [Tsukamurella sp. 8F]|uniref:hemophore-related protein n=1 Tax=unclassified Tsukamurella TaxID=2633480 RepID=UPI0023B9580D|nr:MULTISPECIES: hemophore-related protein [unclassified Tsukamurella]MDF0528680.1 hemophore-related protein [Tsukamurella sp. 8J]MDF0585642.1 hemophore-related protein [Tsukamurella sp. 8F]